MAIRESQLVFETPDVSTPQIKSEAVQLCKRTILPRRILRPLAAIALAAGLASCTPSRPDAANQIVASPTAEPLKPSDFIDPQQLMIEAQRQAEHQHENPYWKMIIGGYGALFSYYMLRLGYNKYRDYQGDHVVGHSSYNDISHALGMIPVMAYMNTPPEVRTPERDLAAMGVNMTFLTLTLGRMAAHKTGLWKPEYYKPSSDGIHAAVYANMMAHLLMGMQIPAGSEQANPALFVCQLGSNALNEAQEGIPWIDAGFGAFNVYMMYEMVKWVRDDWKIQDKKLRAIEEGDNVSHMYMFADMASKHVIPILGRISGS